MNNEFKKGNLIFLSTHLIDLFYIVKGMEGKTTVIARKIDAPTNQWEKLPIEKVTKLAEEQEKLLPTNITTAIEEQRKIVFAPPKAGSKRKRSLEKMMKSLPKEGIEEILAVLAEVGIEEREREENGGEEE